jgi:hypothetical protein
MNGVTILTTEYLQEAQFQSESRQAKLKSQYEAEILRIQVGLERAGSAKLTTRHLYAADRLAARLQEQAKLLRAKSEKAQELEAQQYGLREVQLRAQQYGRETAQILDEIDRDYPPSVRMHKPLPHAQMFRHAAPTPAVHSKFVLDILQQLDLKDGQGSAGVPHWVEGRAGTPFQRFSFEL